MAKRILLNPDEAKVLLALVTKQKFGLDDDEKRLTCIGIRERLQGIVKGIEDLFPEKPEDGDDDSEAD